MMLVSNVYISLFRVRTIISESLGKYQLMYYHGRVNPIAKRGSILKEMITNKDRRKNWHFSIISNKPKARIFDKIHKPFRRRAVLNSLFIRNITDVISMGEITPEISNCGIEITGVQVSPCYQILNVFWQLPVSRYGESEEISQILNIASPKIRAELISRNVLGRVPFIFFIRDCTNARVSAFEQAMEKLESEPKSTSVIVDDTFTEDMYSFKDSKVKSAVKSPEPIKTETKQEDITVPKKPLDMKCDVFGLNHNEMIEKVVAMKKKNPPPKSAVISPTSLANEDDIFSKIPGIRFKANSAKEEKLNRDAILKKFHIERKMLMEKHKIIDYADDYEYYEEDSEEGNDIEISSFDEDFVENEVTDK